MTDLELSNRHIHRHCFSGSVNELTTWLQTLPNCYFGIIKLVIENEKIREAVKEIPLSRLLIELDSPYLSSSPWDIFPVIQEISIIKKIPVPQLIEQCNQTVLLYMVHFKCLKFNLSLTYVFTFVACTFKDKCA